MQRREFIAILGGTLAILPLAARAQQQAKRPRVGILLYSTPQTDPNIQAFIRALQDVGYVDGQNVILEIRYAEGKPERLPQLAAELVGLNPDVLLAMGGDVTPFVSQATQTTAIVFVMSADPVQLGVVASLARPGGNATGFTFLHDELAGKRLQFLKEVAPHIAHVAMLFNPDHPDNDAYDIDAARVKHEQDLATATSRVPGLPRVRPSSSATWSDPITSRPGTTDATLRALPRAWQRATYRETAPASSMAGRSQTRPTPSAHSPVGASA
jgi:hypothetical protein